MTDYTIHVAQDYSATPLGRYRKHGEFSGERFRDEYLIPALERHKKIAINFDGVAGLPSSFLEEAFGGIIRSGKITAEDFFLRVSILVTTPSLTLAKDRIKRYMKSAEEFA